MILFIILLKQSIGIVLSLPECLQDFRFNRLLADQDVVKTGLILSYPVNSLSALPEQLRAFRQREINHSAAFLQVQAVRTGLILNQRYAVRILS